MNLLWVLVIAAVACRLFTGKWPWEFFRAALQSSDEAQARSTLGVTREAGRQEILDAHRRLVARVHPDRGGTAEQVHQANAARDLLLHRLPSPEPERR